MDAEDRIKHMFYDWDKEKELILKIQKCQRNWDHSKWDSKREIYKEIVDYLLWIATNSPSKQHEGYYDVYYTMNRQTIEEILQLHGEIHKQMVVHIFCLLQRNLQHNLTQMQTAP